MVRVEEEVALQAQHPVEEDDEGDREDDDGDPVLLPVLVEARVAAEQAEEAALDDVAALARVDARHPDAQRVAERDQDDRVDDDLRRCPGPSELLSAEERVDEIDEDGERDREPEGVAALIRRAPAPSAAAKINAKQPAAIRNGVDVVHARKR